MPDSTSATIDHSYILPFPRWGSVRGEKKRISIFPWHSTSTSGGIHYRCRCKGTATISLGENAMGNKSDISRAPAISLIISPFAPSMTGHRIRDNELQFCTSRSAARGIRIFSQGKFLVNFTMSKTRSFTKLSNRIPSIGRISRLFLGNAK